MSAYVNNVAATAREQANAAVGVASNTLDAQFPPQKRQEVQDRVQTYAESNPKSAALLSLLALLTVPPVLLFAAFIGSVLVASIGICVTIALAAALSFTGICFAVALLVLLPSLALGIIVSVGVWTFMLITVWIGGQFGVFSPQFTNYTLGSNQSVGDGQDAIKTEYDAKAQNVSSFLNVFSGKPSDQASGQSGGGLGRFEKNPNVVYLREQAQKARNKYGGADIVSTQTAPVGQEDRRLVGDGNDVKSVVDAGVIS